MADGAPTMLRRPLPAWTTELARSIEPLWIASTAALFVLWGYDWIPRVIHMLGHSGQRETIEWAVYMSLLVGFPVVAIVIALALPKVFRGQAATIVKAFVIVVAMTSALMFAFDGRTALIAVALVPAVLGALTSTGAWRTIGERGAEGIIALVLIGIVSLIAWMCAGGLVYWTSATDWFLSSPLRFFGLVVATGITIVGLPRLSDGVESKAAPGVAFRIASIFALLVLIAFSFRTNPIVEFYHWGFWIGPMEQVRQGGWLLRDTPSQYGFLSILIPTGMPGSAWQSFWFFQGLVYAIVAAMMFVMFRKLRGGVGNLMLSILLVFTTLFFRPRSAALILPAQMTPSGGPVRFLWCFVLLAWLLHVWAEARDSEKAPNGNFLIVGHVIWVCSIAWSFEAAIYSSAIWFSAVAVFLAQRGAAEKRAGASATSVLAGVIRSTAVPIGMLIALYAVAWIWYRIAVGAAPDLRGYIEFGLLYSRGFGSLPIATHGAVWYLLLVFFIASTVIVRFLVEDWRDFRLVVAAGVWGAIWSLSSYFVSRSHPVNLLSLAPVLIFALTVLIVVIRRSTRRPWHGLVRAAMVPVLAMPIAMTIGHPGLYADLDTKQLSPKRFTDQLPYMEPELEDLLKRAGAKPSDSFVRIGDGRLMLPAWHGADDMRIMSNKSWLPKPYEIIGSLDAERRMVYIGRNRGGSGWLAHNHSDSILQFNERFAEIAENFSLGQPTSSGAWIVWQVLGPRR
jgi:hypothetical protein